MKTARPIHRHLLVVVTALVLGTVPVGVQERVDLATPIAKPSLTAYHVSILTLNWDRGTVAIELRANAPAEGAFFKTYDATTAPTGATLLIGLNKANLATRSLNQRIFDRLVADGVLTGTVAGAVP